MIISFEKSNFIHFIGNFIRVNGIFFTVYLHPYPFLLYNARKMCLSILLFLSLIPCFRVVYSIKIYDKKNSVPYERFIVFFLGTSVSFANKTDIETIYLNVAL
jgi:hypothetical protein